MTFNKFMVMAGLLASASVFAFSANSQTSVQPIFKLCTGTDSGNYFKAGHLVKSKASSVYVEVINTQGSLDNLDRLTRGECDGAFVQSDALLVFSGKNAKALSAVERNGILYQEHAHLLCNRKSGVDRVTDLTSKHTIAVGPDGSGARTTWDSFVMADKKRYGPVNIDTRAGIRALAAVEDGTAAQCALWVGALGSSFMKNDASAKGDSIVLAGTDDWDMGKVAKDTRGKEVYGYGEIPSGTYPKIQPGGTVFGTKAVKTITVDALFVTNTNWSAANERPFENVLRAFSSAKPTITQLVTPK